MSKRKFKKKAKPSIKQVNRDIKEIKSKMKKEPLMAIATSSVSGTLNATPVVTHIEVGAGFTSEVAIEGQKAILNSVRIKGYIKASVADPKNGRIDVILDRRPTPGTIATFGQIYAPTSGTLLNSTRPDWGKRFKLLATEWGHVGTSSKLAMEFDRFIRLNLVVQTTSNSAGYTQASQNKNAILVVHWTTETADQPTYVYQISSTLMDDN